MGPCLYIPHWPFHSTALHGRLWSDRGYDDGESACTSRSDSPPAIPIRLTTGVSRWPHPDHPCILASASSLNTWFHDLTIIIDWL